MSNLTADKLLAFLDTATKTNAHIWLMTPTGLLLGRPATDQEYHSAMFQHTTIESAEKEKTASLPLSQEEAPYIILLVDAVLNSGGQVFNLGPAMIDGNQVSGWGVYTHLTPR
jgi:hypothetical protein